MMIEFIKLQIAILTIQLQIKVLNSKRTVPNLKGIVRVIVHHGGGYLNFEQVNAMHKKKWGFKSSLGYYVGYQKFIEVGGKLYIARRDNEEGAHTVGHSVANLNKTSVGICLMGNKEDSQVTSEQKVTLLKELRNYAKQGLAITIHSDYSRTLCPGRYTKEWLEQQVFN